MNKLLVLFLFVCISITAHGHNSEFSFYEWNYIGPGHAANWKPLNDTLKVGITCKKGSFVVGYKEVVSPGGYKHIVLLCSEDLILSDLQNENRELKSEVNDLRLDLIKLKEKVNKL